MRVTSAEPTGEPEAGTPDGIARRRALGVLLGAAGAVTLAACGSGSSRNGSGSTTSTSSAESTSSTTAAASAICTEIPEETAGPFPGDGSNGPNVLDQDGVVRADIRSSFGDASGTAEGVPLVIELDVVDVGSSCAPLAGAAVYAWHCDREGRYSLYSPGVTDQNYLRGLQETGRDGAVRFTSIFPGCYSGRWPHVHFEVYSSLADATGGASPIATSQLAFPAEVCDVVFAESGYEQSVRNFAGMSISTDNVFGDDGGADQIGTVTDDVASGYTAALQVGVESS